MEVVKPTIKIELSYEESIEFEKELCAILDELYDEKKSDTKYPILVSIFNAL